MTMPEHLGTSRVGRQVAYPESLHHGEEVRAGDRHRSGPGRFHSPPQLTPELIGNYIDAQIERLRALGYDVDSCLVDLGETAEAVAAEALRSKHFDCVVIGAGLREPPNACSCSRRSSTSCTASRRTPASASTPRPPTPPRPCSAGSGPESARACLSRHR